ncbi:PTS lactose transporter subunit IIC, partial [Salmonella enterica subsp. enterica serovar Typhimurium]
FLGMLFWSFGIHGWNIVGTIARPLWLILLDENTAVYSAGEEIPNIGAEPLYQWFINIGGSGTTIGLALLLVFASKS